jgi:very-short-patch-repair endonuclease
MADNLSLDAPHPASAPLPATMADNSALAPGGSSSERLTAMRESVDRAIARIAARQRTLITWEQLIGCGLGPDAIGYRVEVGRFRVVFRGVYSVVDGQLPPLARELAALLACGERAFLSHHTAAFAWGIRRARPFDVEVSVCGRHCKSRKGLRVHRIRAIHPRELKRHQGLWISSPARAVLEIAATLSPAALADAVDEGLARDLFTPRQLEAVLERNRPCRGAGRLALLLGDETSTAISRSRAEKRLLRLIRAARLPRPETNVKFGRFEPDFMWRREGLVVELDSYKFHQGPGVFQRDREKDLALRDAGFEVLRFTGEHVVHQPAVVLARVAAALARRTAGG